MLLQTTTGRISFGLLFLLSTVGSAPGTLRRWYHPSVLALDNDEQGECVRLEDQVCNAVFNRSAHEEYVKFPNTRGMTMEASRREFLDFAPLLIKNCSLKLWTLLCFHYFPQCCPELPLRYAVTPCRETCEEAKRRCFGIMEFYNMTWPEHMECSKFNSSSSDRLCINHAPHPEFVERALSPAGPRVPDPATTISSSATSTTTTSSTTSTSTSVTESTTQSSGDTTPVAVPTPEPSTPDHALPCRHCNYRHRANAGTFKRNNFAFAANVTIIGIHETDGYHAYLAEVTQTWILDQENCSQHIGLTYILVRASYSHCNRCPDLTNAAGSSGVDNKYLIGGYCNDRGWTLPPNDSLASNWYSHSKYQTKISEWVQSGIAERQRQSEQR